MDKSLQTAAETRQQLSDRSHSDSTELHFEEVLSAALTLCPGERAMLAEHLLASLDDPDQKEIDAAWAEEAERRMREIDEGKVELIDGELVMKELRARFKSSGRKEIKGVKLMASSTRKKAKPEPSAELMPEKKTAKRKAARKGVK